MGHIHALHRPDSEDPLDVLAKVGGLDIAAMCGVYPGAAKHRIPVVIDGFISVGGRRKGDRGRSSVSFRVTRGRFFVTENLQKITHRRKKSM